MSTVRNNFDSVCLGDFLFEYEVGRLEHKEGEQAFLRPQTAAVLRMLCQSPGQLVLRDDLISEVWPDLAVTDDSLTQCISEIRRALGDHKRQLIKTVPKRGFVLTAAVSQLPRPSSSEPRPEGSSSGDLPEFDRAKSGPASISIICATGTLPEALDQVEKAFRSDRDVGQCRRDATRFYATHDRGVAALSFVHKTIAGIEARGSVLPMDCPVAAEDLAEMSRPGQILTSVDLREAAIAEPSLDFEDLGEYHLTGQALALRVFQVSDRTEPAFVAPHLRRADMRPTLAILPLHGVNNSRETEMLGEFISGEITSCLSRSGDVNVISRLSCLPFLSSPRSVLEIAGQLRADFIVSGRFFSQNNRLQIDLELASAETQKILWTDRFQANPEDLFNGFDALADVVGQICKAIVMHEIRNVQAQRLDTLKNYSVLFGAVGLMHRLSPHDFERSKHLLATLVARVPHHAAPRAWLARWYVLKVMQGWSEDPIGDAHTALQTASQALDIEPENVLALTSTGFVLTNLLRRLDDAHETYSRALDIKPNDPHARALLGMLYAFQDRGQEAVVETENALHLTPLDPHRFFFLALAAGASLTAGDYDRALELTHASLRHNRTHVSTQRMLVATTILSGDIETGRLKASELMTMQPNLRVNDWLKQSPSADFEVGQRIAKALRKAGIPE